MVSIYFGSPGAGKTTLACKFIKKQQKRYKHFYTTFGVERLKNTRTISDVSQLGLWTFPEHSLFIDDEAGVTYNNRKFKSLPQYTIEYHKKHRHYKVDEIFMSQSWEDMDITLRRLATEYWYIKKIGPWTLARRVYKMCVVDSNTHQIIDGYKMASFFALFTSLLSFIFRKIPILNGFFSQTWTLTFRPFYYKYFDTHERANLPVIDALAFA